MAKRLRLGRLPAETLIGISAELGGRPELVERAAGVLALRPKSQRQGIIVEIAMASPAVLTEQLEAASRQALKILSHMARLTGPADAGTIARAANVSGNVVSTQMGRLAEIGLVTIARATARDHRYAFTDPVAQRLYSAMLGPPEVELVDVAWTLCWRHHFCSRVCRSNCEWTRHPGR